MPATATIQFPSGVSAEPYLSIDGISYTAVSGGTPGSPTILGSAVTIPLGGDLADTVTANLFAAAVTLFSQWNAAVVMTGASSFTLNLTAKTPGTGPNGSVIVCNEAYCVLSTVPWGGAVNWLSALSINSERIGVSLAAYTPGYEGGVYLVVTTTYPGAIPQPTTVCWCNCSGGWNFWADDYSMCLWMTGTVDVGVPNGRDFIYSGVSRDCRVEYLVPPAYWPAFTTWDPLRTLLSQSGNGAAEWNGVIYSTPNPFRRGKRAASHGCAAGSAVWRRHVDGGVALGRHRSDRAVHAGHADRLRLPAMDLHAHSAGRVAVPAHGRRSRG